MKIVNTKLLASMDRSRCAWCRRAAAGQIHHLFTRGAGHLDVRINLVSLCSEHHASAHDGTIERDDLMGLVADREGIANPSNIQEVIWMLKRLPKAPTRQDIDRELAGLNNGARAIVLPILKAHTTYIIKTE